MKPTAKEFRDIVIGLAIAAPAAAFLFWSFFIR
jgi:hypothetical protein